MISEENQRLSDEDYGTYYARLLGASYRAGEAVKIHETWKRRLMMGSGVTEQQCMQRILVVLRELLKSDFLMNDYIDTGVPKDDRNGLCRNCGGFVSRNCWRLRVLIGNMPC